METKHQHIVPACYLANWGISGNHNRKSEVYSFNMNDRQVRVNSVNHLPKENYFYDIPELGEDNKVLEEFFCDIEGEYATLLRKVLKRIADRQNMLDNREPILSDEDRNNLTVQFALQIVRTQKFRSFYKYIYRTLKEAFPWGVPELVKDDFRRMHTNEIMSFDLANFYVNLLNDRNWIFLINCSNVSFFTSDNPGIFIDHRINRIEPISPASKEVTFYMSLSPTVAVELYDKSILKVPEIHIPIEFPGIVQGYNKRLFSECTRFMFSNKNDFSCLIGGEK